MSQRSDIDAAVLLKSVFRRNLRNITIRQTRDELAAQEAPVTPGLFSFRPCPGFQQLLTSRRRSDAQVAQRTVLRAPRAY